MGWGRIRVWNDDQIAAKSGFPPHPHRDMEIVTYVRTGAITHQDSLGNKGRTGAGDVQVMSAGTGVTHAEYQSRGRGDDPVPDLDRDRPAAAPAGLGRDALSEGGARRRVPAARQRRRGGRRADHQRRRAHSRRDGQGRRRRSSSTPSPSATSIWSRAAGCGSTASPPAPRDGVAITGEDAARDRGRRGCRTGAGRRALASPALDCERFIERCA